MNSLIYRPEIDGLRAVAVLAVVAYHLFPGLLSGGLAGVDVFFVISGFLITSILIKKPAFSFGLLLEFYIRRVRRLFPALLAVLVATFVFGWFALYPDDFKELGFHIFSSSIFISNFVYMGEAGYFDRASELKPLLHLWSLAVEEQFYIVWPLLVFPIVALARPKWVVALLALASFVLCVYLTEQESSAAYYMPLSRFWEILAGAWLAIAYRNGPAAYSVSSSPWMPWLGLGVLLGSLGLINTDLGFPGWQALFPVLATVLLIHSAGQRGPVNFVLSNPVAVYIGKISYPLYLWHWPIISYINVTESTISPALRIAALLASLVLAALTYALIEKPFHKARGKSAAVLVLLMALVGYIGYNAYSREGLNFRPVNYQAYKLLALNYVGLGKRQVAAPAGADTAGFLQRYPDYPAQLFQVAQTLKATKNPADTYRLTVNGVRKPAVVAPCVGDNCQDARPLVVVLGDSYAINLDTTLVNTHPEYQFKLFADAGCLPLRKRYRKETHRCRVLLDQVDQFLTNRSDVKALILVGRWPLALDGLEQEIAHFKTLVPRVGLIGPGMTYDKDITATLLQADSPKGVFDTTVALQQPDRFLTNNLMQQLAQQMGIPFYDRLAPFCDQQVCRLTETGTELFIYDSGHLTIDGALLLGQDMLHNKWIHQLINEPLK